MKRTIAVICPYCGAKNVVTIEDDYGENKVVTCDPTEGGCEKDFVVKAKVAISVKVAKIEGEEDGQR